MITHLRVWGRRWRRRLSRASWVARLLGLPTRAEGGGETGLIMIQIDGLAHGQLCAALEQGRMPFLGGLLAREEYRLHVLYSGIPSTTPAVQAELFYGERTTVPAFQFLDRDADRLVTMFDAKMARSVEARLEAMTAGLLEGGSAYSDIYAGGAAEANFCAVDFGLSDTLRRAHPVRLLFSLLLYGSMFVRAAALLVIELGLACVDVVRGVITRGDLGLELAFIPKRLALGILLREIIVAGVQVDAFRGVPIIHCNLLGYDEQAHRRGPSSRFAHWTLKGIDCAIRRIWRGASRSPIRDYDIWIYSDHGQEDVVPYVRERGRTIQEAVKSVFHRHGLDVASERQSQRGEAGERLALLGGRRLQRLLAGPRPRTQDVGVRVAGMGPIGHVYLAQGVPSEAHDAVAQDLVTNEGVPCVLRLDAEDEGCVAHLPSGRHRLPAAADAVLGADHPLLEEVAVDLVRLARHPAAGELVLLGWRPQGSPLSFVEENGAHAGPGTAETQAFAVLPAAVSREVDDRDHLRPDDLRRLALGHRPHRPDPSATRRPSRAPTASKRLRVMTYNVHGCQGLDGRVSPARIARVIATYQPDVVALQELDICRERSGGEDQAHAIARTLEMEHHFHPAWRDADEAYGNAVLSRHPLRLVKAGVLPGEGRREPRGVLWVTVDVDGLPVQVITTHLGLYPGDRRRQLRRLLGKAWLGSDACLCRTIFCGDLNVRPNGVEVEAVDRRLLTVPFRPNDRSWLGLWRLDHCFASSDLRVERAEMLRSSLVRLASDHRPLLVDVLLST